MSKTKFAVGILRWDEQIPDVEVIINDEASVRRLIDRFTDRGQLRSATRLARPDLVCTGCSPRWGWHATIAPALIPKAPADRVKTDRRDCRRLARLHRAGELVAIRVPTEAEEAVRDLCRARTDLVADRTRTRHRLSKFLLRHDRIWHQDAWTGKHEQWLTGQRFDNPALHATYGHYAVDAARPTTSRPSAGGHPSARGAYRQMTCHTGKDVSDTTSSRAALI